MKSCGMPVSLTIRTPLRRSMGHLRLGQGVPPRLDGDLGRGGVRVIELVLTLACPRVATIDVERELLREAAALGAAEDLVGEVAAPAVLPVRADLDQGQIVRAGGDLIEGALSHVGILIGPRGRISLASRIRVRRQVSRSAKVTRRWCRSRA